MTQPLQYPEKPFDRGKVLDAKALEEVKSWGRYRDVEGDGIPYRTLPGTEHPLAGYFTRGSGHDENAHYSENPAVFKTNLDRLARKHDTARTYVPQPLADEAGHSVGIIAYGTTHHAVVEARDRLAEHGLQTDYLRVRALPFAAEVTAFIERHERVFVAEQNRDGQLHALLRAELPAHLVERLHSIRHYNGVPIDAAAITEPLLASEQPVLA
jgi:2-oxoglutarate ferredoxin oxidoreductase subunit alpha